MRVAAQPLGLDGIRGLFASQSGHFTVQSSNNCKQSLSPLCGPRSLRERHLLGILVPEETFSQRPVQVPYDALVPDDVNPTSPDLDRVLCKQLAHRSHELVPRVNLKELRLSQGVPAVNPSKAIGDLFHSLHA